MLVALAIAAMIPSANVNAESTPAPRAPDSTKASPENSSADAKPDAPTNAAGNLAAPTTASAVDVYAPLKMESGIWDAEVTFFEAGKPSGQARGVQVNTLLVNGHWIVNDFSIPAEGKRPAYQGHGVWGFDPVAKTYVNTWVDTNDLATRTDYGYWDAPNQTMVWSTKQNNGEGLFVDYRAKEEFRGDTRIFTFYQLGMTSGTSHLLVKIVFTRRADAAPSRDCEKATAPPRKC